MPKWFVLSSGTSGDVLQLLRLGAELRSRGHDVTAITNCAFADEVSRARLRFVALDTPEEYQALLRDGPLSNSPSGVAAYTRRHLLPSVVRCVDAIRADAASGDRVVIARSAPGLTSAIGDALDAPVLSVFIAPSHASTIDATRDLYTRALAPDLAAVRAALGSAPTRDPQAVSYGACAGLWPSAFGAHEPGWPETFCTAGFILSEDEAPDDIPPPVADLLARGTPPVLITGGTGRFASEAFFRSSLDAVVRLGVPAVIVTAMPDYVPAHLPSHVVHVPRLRAFAAVMRHAAAVVHHGGMGTLGHALQQGVPQLVLAAGGDRPDNGLRLQRLGVGAYLPITRWRSDIVTEALGTLLRAPETRRRCRECAAQPWYAGAARASDFIEQTWPSGARV